MRIVRRGGGGGGEGGGVHVVVVAPVVRHSERRHIAAASLGALESVDGCIALRIDLNRTRVDLAERLHLDVVSERAIAPLALEVRVEVLRDVLREVVPLLLHVIRAQPPSDIMHVRVAVHAVRDAPEEAVAVLRHLADLQAPLRHLRLEGLLLQGPTTRVGVVLVLRVARLLLGDPGESAAARRRDVLPGGRCPGRGWGRAGRHAHVAFSSGVPSTHSVTALVIYHPWGGRRYTAYDAAVHLRPTALISMPIFWLVEGLPRRRRTYAGRAPQRACERRAAATGWQVPAEPTMSRLNSQVLGLL